MISMKWKKQMLPGTDQLPAKWYMRAPGVDVLLLYMAMTLMSGPVMAIQNTATGNSGGVALDTSQATVTLTRDTGSLIVVNTNDSGPGSLRNAMTIATSGQTITFDPLVFDPISPGQIDLLTQLPDMDMGNVTIDASNAGVIIDGGAGIADGITISTDNNVVKGLQIQNFTQHGLSIVTGSGNMIGGAAQADANIVVANGGDGIHHGSTGSNTIAGNFIGEDSAANPAPNIGNGITLVSGTVNLTNMLTLNNHIQFPAGAISIF